MMTSLYHCTRSKTLARAAVMIVQMPTEGHDLDMIEDAFLLMCAGIHAAFTRSGGPHRHARD